MPTLRRRDFALGALAIGSLSLATTWPTRVQSAGFLSRLLGGVAGAPPIDLTFVPSIAGAETVIPEIKNSISPDACYIELYLESVRLSRARKFFTRFQGVAYSFVTLAREGEPHAQLASISKPEKLVELDRNSIDNVIVVSKQMMGPAAFRGGPVLLEFGLFSVKSGNLLSPVLDYVTRVSAAAGNSYVGAIKPFLPLITEGMDLIAGQREDAALEVGVDTSLNMSTGCVSAIIDQPRGSIDVAKLSLDEDRKLLLSGKPLNAGYAVFSFRPTLEKYDYGEIPELKERFAAINSAIRAGKAKEAQDALTAFRLAAIASPDLIPVDAIKLVEKAAEKVKQAFPAGHIVDFKFDGVDIPKESLSDIKIYIQK